MSIINAVNSLPGTPQEREQIIKRIQVQIARLQNDIKENIEDQKLVRQNEQYIQLLKLRHNLIKRCGELSLLRLSHLEEVFKHYCTHVFRVGKHMTFDRLQYDKVHMTMERFFLFLRDFHMTIALIQQKSREVIDKNHIIKAFKKISSSSRDLSFQEFVQAIQKLAVIYWDQKQNYSKKQQQNRLRLQKIKMMNEKRRKKKLGIKSQGSDKQNSEQKQDEKEQSVQKQNSQSKNKAPPQPNKAQNNQNDDLVQELMKNQQIQDPNDQVREVAEKAMKQNAEVQSVLNKQIQQFQSLLRVSNQQKIEHYYQLINIDSVQNYKNKLTQLNLQNYISHNTKKQAKALSQSKLEAAMQQQEERLMKLKAKMNEKKEKIKERPLPKPNNEQALKEEQNSKRRKQMKKQRQKNVKQHKVQQIKKVQTKAKNQTPKIEYKEGEVSWKMLQKLTLEHLKLKQFNLAKMYAPEEDDRYFLQQYGGFKPKIASRLQARERQSLSIVESTKMRAEQIQKKQKQKGIQSIKRNNKGNNTSFSRNKI